MGPCADAPTATVIVVLRGPDHIPYTVPLSPLKPYSKCILPFRPPESGRVLNSVITDGIGVKRRPLCQANVRSASRGANNVASNEGCCFRVLISSTPVVKASGKRRLWTSNDKRGNEVNICGCRLALRVTLLSLSTYAVLMSSLFKRKRLVGM